MKRFLLLVVLLALAGLAGSQPLETWRFEGFGSWANSNVQSAIGLPGEEGTVLEAEGAIAGPSVRLELTLDGQPLVTEAQSRFLVEGHLPLVETEREVGALSAKLTLFRAPSLAGHPDVALVSLTNSASVAQATHLGFMATLGQGEAPVVGDALIQQANLVLVASPDSELAVQNTALRAESLVAGVSRWAPVGAKVQQAFGNIRVGWGGQPVRYQYKCEPDAEAKVFLGLMEGYWHEAGQRLQWFQVEGAAAVSLDLWAEHGNSPFILPFDASDTNGDGQIDIATGPAEGAGDINSLLNVIWVFPPSMEIADYDLLQGTANAQALAWVDCGVSDLFQATGGWDITLAPGETLERWLLMPSAPVKQFEAFEVAKLKASAIGWWKRFNSRLAQYQVPDTAVMDAYYASVANVVIAADRVGEYLVVKPGETIYDGFWYRDGAYLQQALDLAGLKAMARDAIKPFFRQGLPAELKYIEQRPDGSWQQPPLEWDGMGQAPWAILRHSELAGDTETLAEAWPALARGADWTIKARAENSADLSLDDPGYGLLPIGEGEAIAHGYIYYHNFWALYGLELTARAARLLGKGEESDFYQAAWDEYRKALYQSIRRWWVPTEEGGYVPGEPDKPATRVWGDVNLLWPCGVYSPSNSLLRQTLDFLESNNLEGQYQFITNVKIWPYISTDWAQTYLRLGEREKAQGLFWAYLNHAATNRAWIEEIYPDATRVGTGDMPHCWAAADYVLLLRAMLVNEGPGDTLELLSGAPRAWLEGEGIKVKRAPTTHGEVAFTARIAGSRLLIELDSPDRSPACLKIDLAGLLGACVPEVLINGKSFEPEGGVVWLVTLPGEHYSLEVPL